MSPVSFSPISGLLGLSCFTCKENHIRSFLKLLSPLTFYDCQYFLLNQSQFLLFIVEISLCLKSLQLLAEESLPTTPFYFILGKHRQQQDKKINEALESELVQLPLTENIPAISEVSNS